MLDIRDLSVRYAPHAPWVLNGVDLHLERGQIGIMLGKNGAGKTTLFKTILGIQKPSRGSIRFDGEDLLSMRRRERAMRIAYVPQRIQFGALSVYETILLGRVARFGLKAGDGDRRVVLQISEAMQLQDLLDRNVETLSGGERQKVAIARALAQEPKLLVFDEPTGSLDLSNEQLILSEAKRAKARGVGVLLSLHDLNEALALGDRFFLMKDGKIRFAGGREVLTEATIEDIFDAKVRIVNFEGQPHIIHGGI